MIKDPSLPRGLGGAVWSRSGDELPHTIAKCNTRREQNTHKERCPWGEWGLLEIREKRVGKNQSGYGPKKVEHEPSVKEHHYTPIVESPSVTQIGGTQRCG